MYLIGINPVEATAYSLFIVGITSLIGGIKSTKVGMVDFKKVIVFGIPSVVAAYITRRYLVPAIPEQIFSFSTFVLTKNMALMILFALVMLLAAYLIIKKEKHQPLNPNKPPIIWISLQV